MPARAIAVEVQRLAVGGKLRTKFIIGSVDRGQRLGIAPASRDCALTETDIRIRAGLTTGEVQAHAVGGDSRLVVVAGAVDRLSKQRRRLPEDFTKLGLVSRFADR